MKRPASLLVVLVFVFTGYYALATPPTMYVIDVVKLGVRNKPDRKEKSVSIIQTADAVEVLKIQNQWVQIKIDDRRQGWVLKKYLTEEPPLLFRYQKLAAMNQQLQAELSTLKQANQQLDEAQGGLTQQIETLRQQLVEATQNPPKEHAQDSAYQTLQSEYDQLAAQLSALRSNPQAPAGIMHLSQRDYLFFITGAAVLLLGVLLGYVSRRKKRQSFLV